jgi:DNA-binding winged helix-turn-helix (wHTH) protein
VELLRVPVDRAGVPVSKEALIEAAWPGLAVEASSLTVQIAALRRMLREAPDGERWIEMLPRRAYRFVGPLAAYQRNDAPAKNPLANTAEETRNNLPVQLASFIGRTAALARSRALLDPTAS